MLEWTLTAPIALILFNRPNETRRVFATIRRARPPKLFLIADGPRADRPEDVDKCKAARAEVERVDWPCEVFRNYSDANLGCGQRPASGISWVFEHVDRAIFLEDDCVPHPTFFRFCDELLDKFVDDPRVMRITGYNWDVRGAASTSYFFSLYGSCWGWATWRRAWKHFDYDINLWPVLARDRFCEQMTISRKTGDIWADVFEFVHRTGKQHVWDHQWTLACWLNGLTIVPSIPLISNIGFGANATHTTERSRWSSLKASDMQFPLRHPLYVARNLDADRALEQCLYSPDLRTRARRKFHKLLARVTSRK